MKSLIFAGVLLTTLSANAKILKSAPTETIRELINRGECEATIHKDVIFRKGYDTISAGSNVIVHLLNVNDNVDRKISAGRKVKLFEATEELFATDPSIHSIFINGRPRSKGDLTLSEINSTGVVSVVCHEQAPVEI